MSLYTQVLRPILFSIDPDLVHEMVGVSGYLLGQSPISQQILKSLFYYQHPSLESEVFGIHFKNPIGVAGGFDKECRLIQTLPYIGFGFNEVGSITALPYQGNPRPWNYRLKADQSLLVNYGLKNKGVDILKKRIKQQKKSIPLIINIAKTNDPNISGDDSVEDYNKSFIKLQEVGDIINLNISCPNTGDGQLFCESPVLLKKLLKKISTNKINKPIVLKLKPDLDDQLLQEVVDICTSFDFVKGFIISNLTKNRKLLKATDPRAIENIKGGVSGKPLFALSNQMIKKVYIQTKGKYPIIGVGGVFSGDDAYQKICLGASLVEIATGLIYQGPGVVKEINQRLVQLLKKDGFSHISEAIGSRV